MLKIHHNKVQELTQDKMKINIFRKGEQINSLHLNSSNYAKALMDDHTLTLEFRSSVIVDIQIGDYLTYKDELMTVNTEPECANEGVFNYVITFQGLRHTLQQWLYRYEDALYFDFFGTAAEQLSLYITFLNSIDAGWTFEDLSGSDVTTNITFDKLDLFSALNLIAESYQIEWRLVGKHISIGKNIGENRSLTLSYGMGKGLYNLRRISVINSRIVTRAFAMGGSQNLPEGYTKKQLTLPGFIDDPDAKERFGIREGVIEDETIFPNRTAAVTDIGQINEGTWIVADDSLDFDLQVQFIDGTEPKIVFKSGALSGQEFKILGYNHDRKEIRYEANKDSNGALIPRESYKAAVDDQYTLVGIRMPQSYVDAALTALEEKRAEYLASNKAPRVVYELSIDVLNLKRLNTEIFEGDKLTIIDERMGINEIIRVNSISYPGHFPYVLENGMQFTAEVGNEMTYTRTEKIEKDIKDTSKEVTQVSRESIENDRRNVVALQEFMGKVFDPDGNLQEPLIKAIVGFFGTESMLYDLDGVTYVVNVGGDPNAFSISGGQLIHKAYEIEGLGYVWDLSGLAVTGLDPLKSYYLSARCSKTALTGEWVLSETQIPTEGEVGYWHFNLGVLSSVIEGERTLLSTMGYTIISGGNIVTDSITAYQINVQKLFARIIEMGSDGYTNAGISGLSDADNQSVRFWAGADAENRNEAPFRVLNDGSMVASKGKIGNFSMDNDRLFIGSEDTWMAFMQSVFLYGDYAMFRDNGAVAGERRELSWNLYKNQTGAPIAAAASIFNTINTFDDIVKYTNIALELEADKGNINYALLVRKGITSIKGLITGVQGVKMADTVIDNDVKNIIVNSLTGGVGNPNLFMPANAQVGREITVKNNSGTGCSLQANTGNGSFLQSGGGLVNPMVMLNNNVKTFFFDGSNWIETSTH